MPSASQTIRVIFGGGWATDFGAAADVGAAEDGRLVLPFMSAVENAEYLLDGGLRKIGGASKLNSAVVESGQDWTGIFDRHEVNETKVVFPRG